MTMRRLAGALLCLAVTALFVTPAGAVVLVSDDFNNPGIDSGYGWVSGSDWTGNGTVSDGVINFGDIGRHFAEPIDPFDLGKVYISVDYTQTSITDGNDGARALGSLWGGITLYEPDNAEALFIGNPWGPGTDGLVDYGVATNTANVDDNILHSGVDFDDQLHTLITQIDTTVQGAITYRFWFEGNTDLLNPTDSLTVPTSDSPINTEWGFLYFRSDTTNTTNIGDNLIIATDSSDVGLQTDPGAPVVTVDRATGEVTLSSVSPVSNVTGYTMSSNSGGFEPSGWTPVTGNFDGQGDGSFDDDDWMVVVEIPNALGEVTVDTDPGDGATLDSTGLNLGNAWYPTPYEDIVANITVDNGGVPESIPVLVEYVGDVPAWGDFDYDGDLDADDWATFRAGQGLVTTGIPPVLNYKLGDMNGDGSHDLVDYMLFRQAYDDANSAGAFDKMVAGVPEPSSLMLLGGIAGGALLVRRRQQCLACLALLAAVAFQAAPAQATIFASDDFSSTTSGTGWAAGSDWGNIDEGVSDTAAGNNAFRVLETPLEPYNQTTYIAFDFQTTTVNSWGGVAFFEDDGSVDGYGAETLFIGSVGDGSGIGKYGIDLKQGTALPETSLDLTATQVDANWHRLIVGIEFDPDGMSPYQDTYSLWVDNFDVNSPDDSVVIEDSPILDAWKSVRIASDVGGGKPVKVDHFVLTDDVSVAFAKPLELVVNKATGEVELQNNSGGDLAMSGYTITSESGTLVTSGGPADGDYNNDNIVDQADYTVWRNNLGASAGTLPNDPNGTAIGVDQYLTWKSNFGESGTTMAGWDSLQAQDLAGFPSGSGSGDGWEEGGNPSATELAEYYLLGESMVGSSSISLGNAYGAGADGTEDLQFTYFASGEIYHGLVTYVSGVSTTMTAVPEPTSAGLLALLAAVSVMAQAKWSRR